MTHGGSGSSTGLNNAPSLIVLHVLYTASIRPWYLGHEARAVMKFMIVLTAGALHSSNGSTSDVRDFNGECKLLMIRLWLITLRITVILSCLAFAQDSKHAGAPEDATSPEMKRLATALAGDWNNVETMERSEFFPNGGGRRGISHCRLSTGGTTLSCEGESDGSAGKLNHLIVIWWDKDPKLYRFFTCFKDYGSGCQVRGTAHWEGDVFVNDFEESVKGTPTKFRDSFTEITPASHTLVAAMQTSSGSMQILITTRSTRR